MTIPEAYTATRPWVLATHSRTFIRLAFLHYMSFIQSLFFFHDGCSL